MKKRQLKELREKTINSLEKDIDSVREDIVKARIEILNNTTQDVRKVKNLRKHLAQLLTIKNELIQEKHRRRNVQ